MKVRIARANPFIINERMSQFIFNIMDATGPDVGRETQVQEEEIGTVLNMDVWKSRWLL